MVPKLSKSVVSKDRELKERYFTRREMAETDIIFSNAQVRASSKEAYRKSTGNILSGQFHVLKAEKS